MSNPFKSWFSSSVLPSLLHSSVWTEPALTKAEAHPPLLLLESAELQDLPLVLQTLQPLSGFRLITSLKLWQRQKKISWREGGSSFLPSIDKHAGVY